jgi:predicted RNA binding protein YcfA (HicA-like mRNA interferase family)
MKRRQLIRHLESHGGSMLRDGGKHSLYVNPANNQVSAVPGHREINEFLVRKICRDLGIQAPSSLTATLAILRLASPS